jgi:hypothetical protein
MRRSLFTATLVLVAMPVWAQQVKIAFHDGQVSVDSAGASPRVILAEWSRVGGTNIINADRVTGGPLTLKLVDVPEAQALEIILKSVAGYMAAPRGQTAGASRYDRILVLPTSSTPVPSPVASGRPNGNGPGFGPAQGTQRFVPPRPVQPQPVEEAPEVDDPPQEPPPAEPVFTFPQTNQSGSDPAYRVQPVRPAAPPSVMDSDGVGLSTTPPPFGVVGAPMPGMIQVPQPQQQPAAPGRPTRPPGQ